MPQEQVLRARMASGTSIPHSSSAAHHAQDATLGRPLVRARLEIIHCLAKKITPKSFPPHLHEVVPMSQRAKGKKKRDILVNAELIYKVMGNHHIASSYMCSLSAFVSPCNSFLDDGNVWRVRARAGLRDGGSLVDESGVVKHSSLVPWKTMAQGRIVLAP
jgi:hypothetical protein